MTLILRIIYEYFRSRVCETTTINDEVIAHFKVLPMDLDFNGHMTNNRYHTIMDYSALRLMGSHGILAAMFRKKWRPIVGCSLVSHRKSLQVFDNYTVKAKIIYCDALWTYISHIIETDGQIIAAANRKYALLGQGKLIKTKLVFKEIEQDFNNKPSNIDSIRSWIDAEKTVLELSRTEATTNQEVEMETTMECKKEIAATILEGQDEKIDSTPCLYAGLACAEQVGCTAQKKVA